MATDKTDGQTRRTRYTDLIVEATGCTSSEAKEIEDYMRDAIFHSTLDWQTRAQLVRAARKAQKELPESQRLLKILLRDGNL